ncbi:MAG: hypothetical protein ACI4RQ_04275, partial [Methanobrevibacter wolinii]|uniref:hypothetical protein n=1 Tax=Methanobrevibacter wolinii TaxID=190977 RepID=UPI0005B2A269|nr:hypothetical protein [Methanobrevibacter wolinii]MDD5960088.1 hypothetical protein [Methanobrevibacter wolinii]
MAKDDICMLGVFSDEFMKKYTKFSSFDEMKKKSPFGNQATADLFNNPKWDTFVKKTTKFKDWQEMLITSANQMLKKDKI